MNIQCIGFNSIYGREYSFSSEPEKDVYMLVLARSRIIFHIDGRRLKYPENTLVLYDENAVREYSADSNFLVCDWICFDTEGDAEFLDTLELPVNRPLRFADTEFISSLISNISAEYYSIRSRRTKMIDVLMKTLLMKISEVTDSRDSLRQTSDPHYSALIELREKVYRNPQMKWNVDTMAADVNMSRSYFQHVYREVFGISCMSDVINGKIEKAKEILSETSCTISQVSAMCGYDNEEHFMRQFKKIVGITPTGYRKKN